MYAKDTLIEVELNYNTSVTEKVTLELQKAMSATEIFSIVENLCSGVFLLQKYRVSVSDRWSQWHYVA